MNVPANSIKLTEATAQTLTFRVTVEGGIDRAVVVGISRFGRPLFPYRLREAGESTGYGELDDAIRAHAEQLLVLRSGLRA